MNFHNTILSPGRRRWLLLLITGLTAFALITVACGGDDDTGAAEPAATEAPADSDDGDGDADPYADLSGEIRIDGSSTVFPIAEAMAEEFGYVSDVRVNVAFSGTGGGFEKFCRGETQISDASRPIKDSEVEACAENGIDDIVEIQVAIDALTVMIHPDNDFAQCMTVAELNQAFSADSAKKWSDIRSEWPDSSASSSKAWTRSCRKSATCPCPPTCSRRSSRRSRRTSSKPRRANPAPTPGGAASRSRPLSASGGTAARGKAVRCAPAPAPRGPDTDTEPRRGR